MSTMLEFDQKEMKKPYTIAIHTCLIVVTSLVTWLCIVGISDVLSGSESNPGRPGFHVTALVGWFLWAPIPIVVLGVLFRKLLAGIYMLLASLYFIAFVVFWDLILPTCHTLLTDSLNSLILVPTMLLLIFLSALAIRTSKPKEGVMMRFTSYPGILAAIMVLGAICFSFHCLAAGEDMRVASAYFNAQRHAYWEDFDGALKELDIVLQRYGDDPPNTHRIDALVLRARLRRHVGDMEGYDRDMQRIKTIAREHEDLAEHYRVVVRSMKSNKATEGIGE